IIRSAWCAGADALIIPKDRAASLTGAVAKASAGAAFVMSVARVTNLTEAIKMLQEAGLWVIGLDPAGDQVLYEVDLRAPTALVVGGEDKGLRPRVRGACDVVARLPMPIAPNAEAGEGRSLNAAVAAAVALFEAVRQRRPDREGDLPQRP
ncbi:MAG: RNA methyltransferase, partial [Proteobacteria bacterium]|nr:RNA methyltransferase [Pseudomonadota bacterium]